MAGIQKEDQAFSKDTSRKDAEQGVLLDGIERIVTNISDHNKENMTTLVSSLKGSLTKEESLTPRAPSIATTASTQAVTVIVKHERDFKEVVHIQEDQLLRDVD